MNAKNDHGFMPLHIAVAQGNGGTAKLLVDAGARYILSPLPLSFSLFSSPFLFLIC